ncbi:MAG TPA: NADH-quinone oxidoreductase subunit NuoK [Chthoniobacteraceae bacterium]|jgi:NADH-quinone oxidoreductase subunit K|nr:NADH-quinone oxidoreductase subunit NuoK [Chthoniobacteraceae bacterium]
MNGTLAAVLAVSMVLFSLGLLAALSRRDAIFMLIGIEMMLAAGNLNLVAFWRYGPQPELLTGAMMALFAMAIAAGETAVGLALVLAVYRHRRTTQVEKLNTLKG